MKNLKDGKTYVIDLRRKVIQELPDKEKNLKGFITEIDVSQIADVLEYGNGKVGIELSDGEIIPFETSTRELALLKSVVLENRKRGIIPSTPIRKRPLTEEEKDKVLKDRSISAVSEIVIKGMVSLGLFGYASIFLPAFPPEAVEIIGTVFLVIILGLSIFMILRPSSFIEENEKENEKNAEAQEKT